MKNSKSNNTILDFSFMYLVSVYPTNRAKVPKVSFSMFIYNVFNCTESPHINF